MDDIKKLILEILDKNGIYIAPTEAEEDLDLREFILDSLQYVNLIVELEKSLDIEFPDEILQYDNLSSINGFVSLISEMLQESRDDDDDDDDSHNSVRMTWNGNVINMSNC